MNRANVIVLTIGFAGQLMFFLRFLFQWIYTEKHKKSIIPNIFWYFSLWGGILILIYAILKRDIVFIIGQSMGTFIYLRNIYYLRRESRQKEVYAD
jgi:lipid-A-disaccharide synthase-like uncharacterized protein